MPYARDGRRNMRAAEAARARTMTAPLDRRVFCLTLPEFRRFSDALVRPGRNRRLQKLLSTKVPWDQ